MRYLPFLFVIFGAVLLVSLAQKHTPSTDGIAHYVPPPIEDPRPVDNGGPGLCFAMCVGPHINFNSGELELFSFGPGFSF